MLFGLISISCTARLISFTALAKCLLLLVKDGFLGLGKAQPANYKETGYYDLYKDKEYIEFMDRLYEISSQQTDDLILSAWKLPNITSPPSMAEWSLPNISSCATVDGPTLCAILSWHDQQTNASKFYVMEIDGNFLGTWKIISPDQHRHIQLVGAHDNGIYPLSGLDSRLYTTSNGQLRMTYTSLSPTAPELMDVGLSYQNDMLYVSGDMVQLDGVRHEHRSRASESSGKSREEGSIASAMMVPHRSITSVSPFVPSIEPSLQRNYYFYRATVDENKLIEYQSWWLQSGALYVSSIDPHRILQAEQPQPATPLKSIEMILSTSKSMDTSKGEVAATSARNVKSSHAELVSVGLSEVVATPGGEGGLIWHYGAMIPGTPAVRIDTVYGPKFLAFYESSDRIAADWCLTYLMGAYLFSIDPPFKTTHFSSVPIIPNQLYNETFGVLRTGTNFMVNPRGLIERDGLVYVSVGHNGDDAWMVVLNKTALVDSLVPVRATALNNKLLDETSAAA